VLKRQLATAANEGRKFTRTLAVDSARLYESGLRIAQREIDGETFGHVETRNQSRNVCEGPAGWKFFLKVTETLHRELSAVWLRSHAGASSPGLRIAVTARK
jgi:hypothetical protein